MENSVETVSMTAQELADFNRFKAEKAKKEAAEQRKKDEAAYVVMVDEACEASVKIAQNASEVMRQAKQSILGNFNGAIEIKGNIYGIKDGQQSNTFTNTDSSIRIQIGQYVIDNYRDTVSNGIAMVKECITDFAKDDATKTLVNAVLRLLSKDKSGNLKASRILQLRKMAQESGIEKFIEGVRIIEDAYQPQTSKEYVKVEVKSEKGEWKKVPLGMAEA